MNNDEDRLFAGFAVLAVLLPIVGIVQYFMWRQLTPNRANQVLVWSIIGAVINMSIILSG